MTTAISTHVVAPPREWGDGGNKTRKHEVEDISYSTTPNWLTCVCGVRLVDDTASGLAAQWGKHGPNTGVLAFSDVQDRRNPIGTVTSPEDMWKVWAPIVAQSLLCTCVNPKQPSADCPNFIPEKDTHV